MKFGLLFTVVMVLLILIVYFIHYHMIQMEVRKTSRCLRLKERHSAGGVYTVEAVNENSDKLYNVTYDLGAKSSTVDCACPPGNVVNHFRDIPYFDMKTQRTRKIEDQMCGCDSIYDDTRDQIFFEGVPGLVRYMQNQDDTSFFVSEPTYSARSRADRPMLTVSGNATVNNQAVPLYEVSYDVDAMMKGKTTFHTVKCVAPSGTPNDRQLTISNIPVYKKNGATTESITCPADAAYPTTGLSYSGNAGLVDFMGDTSKTTVFTTLIG
jgi:hypothetical protein